MNPGVTGLNYQRMKNSLCPDVSYEELERIYAAKRDFACTASFSSLLFYERRPLKNSGFFFNGPFPDGVDRAEFLWAELADIACSIYEQLWRLRKLTGHSRDYVLGCGGGFRSDALCQMLADLSGLELRLKPGFEQATVLGLVAICNKALGLEAPALGNGGENCYRPRSGELIRRYHTQWSTRRMAANPPVSKS